MEQTARQSGQSSFVTTYAIVMMLIILAAYLCKNYRNIKSRVRRLFNSNVDDYYKNDPTDKLL